MRKRILLLIISLFISANVFGAAEEGIFWISGSNVVMTGSIDVTGANTDVPGSGTDFVNELGIGADITVSTETRTIATITDSDTATVTSPWGSDLANDTSPEIVPYATLDAAEADLAATLTGNLTFLHRDESTATGADIIFDLDTSTFTLTITAEAGAKHDGTFGASTHTAGDGARIVFGASDSLTVDEASDGTLNNIVISDLVFDCKATSSDGILFVDGGDTGTLLLERCIFEGNGNSDDGIVLSNTAFNVVVRNCAVYGFAAAGSLAFRGTPTAGATTVYTFDNNTVAKCTVGMSIPDATINASATITFRNNLLQGNTTDFSIADGDGPYTTSKNWAEDASSPDSLQENFHDGTSNFVDYANNNYLIASGGDSLTNLADGTDLTGTFTDDIIDLTRTAADFFVGASWIDTGAAPSDPEQRIMWFSQYINRLIEQCYFYN